MSIIRTGSQERLAAQDEEAAMLETTLAQARAEEEISNRLPCEVLNISKRLVDKLQGDMSHLMTMVMQISVSLGKQPERTPTPTEPPPTTAAFSTPPHYQPNLSPISEGMMQTDSTPTTTTPPSVRPLQFGNTCSIPPQPTPISASATNSQTNTPNYAPFPPPNSTPLPPPHIFQNTNP
jgi:hypothetical protein